MWNSAKWNFTKDMSATVCTEDGVTAITYLDVPSPWPANEVIERWEYQSYPPRSLESKFPMRFTPDKFFVNRSPSGLIVAFPPCAVAIGFAAIAVAPWIHLSNRFSPPHSPNRHDAGRSGARAGRHINSLIGMRYTHTNIVRR